MKRRGGKALLAAAAVVAAGAVGAQQALHHSTPRKLTSGFQQVTVDGQTRQYILHVPASPQNKAPLMISFHPGGESKDSWSSHSNFTPLSDSKGFIAAYPEWLDTNNGNNCSSLGFTPCPDYWNMGCCDTYRQASDDVDFTNAIIASLEASNNVDPNRIYITGFSLGAYFAWRLACQDNKIAGIGSVGGAEQLPKPQTSSNPVPTSCAPQHPVAIYEMRSTSDFYNGCPSSDCPNAGTGGFGTSGYEPSPAQQNQQWRAFDSCSNTSTTANLGGTIGGQVADSEQTWTSCANGSQVRLDTLANAVGHCWPIVGGCANVDAATQFWNFLSQYTLGAVTVTVPGAPTIGQATAGVLSATVNFTPGSSGSAPIDSYTVTTHPAGPSVPGAQSPITVTGLTAGVSYTFTVTAHSTAGTGPASGASNAVIPTGPPPPPFCTGGNVFLRYLCP